MGDYLTLRAASGKPLVFKVVELLDQRSELLNADLLLLSEEGFRGLFAIPKARYTDAVLTVRNPREVRTVAEKIVLSLPDSRPILREEILRTYAAIFSWREGMVFVALSAVLLAFVMLAWDKASGLSAEERREIGILKAIGWETADVIAMKGWEGALISLTAFFSGYLLAYAHVFYGSAALFTPVLKGWSVLYPAFRLSPVIDGLQIAVLFAGTVLPYTVATLIPIWRAAITDPDAIMRL
jgi:ABC-type lipoprotein release transport system permease subunit